MSDKITIFVNYNWRTHGVVETTTDNLENPNGRVHYMLHGHGHNVPRSYVYLSKEAAYADARPRRAEAIAKLQRKIDELLAIPLGQSTVITAQMLKKERRPRVPTLRTLRVVRRLQQSGERPTAALIHRNMLEIKSITRASVAYQLKLLVGNGKLEYNKQDKAYSLSDEGAAILERWHHDL